MLTRVCGRWRWRDIAGFKAITGSEVEVEGESFVARAELSGYGYDGFRVDYPDKSAIWFARGEKNRESAK